MRANDPSRVGSVVASKYRLEEELGRGGMGAVYRGRHLAVHKEFAIKLLLGELVQRGSIVSRFFLEAQAAGRIGHPGILDVYDVGEDSDGTPFLVMELLSGEPLAALVRRETIDVDAACWIAMEVLDVLAAAHEVGIIHRDVKPQNVFLTERAAPSSGGAASTAVRGVKLLDFGIAKFTGENGSALTRSGEIIGSPLYMAPEQARGEEGVDARADLWSVGAMLFEMLTGTCAHAATTPVAVLAKILTAPAPRASSRREGIPTELDDIVARALEIDRERRWASAREMREALAAVRRERGTADATPALPPSPPRPRVIPSHPPASQTPGAVSATISAQPVDAGAISSTLALPDAAGTAADDDKAMSTSVSTEMPRRWRMVAAAAAGVGALAMVVGWVASGNGARRPAETEAKTAAPAGSSTVSSVTSAPPALVKETTSSSAAPPSDEAGLARVTIPRASGATSAAPPRTPVTDLAKTTAPRVATPGPRCEANEVPSNGHCCPRGLEWQDGRCERPLATTF